MCRIQVIHKRDEDVISDRIFESKSLKKISINNIPYYITVSLEADLLRYELKYLDSPDSENCTINNFSVGYGSNTGRLYYFELKSSNSRLTNKEWEAIKKILTESNLLKVDEILLFIRVLQEIDTSQATV